MRPFRLCAFLFFASSLSAQNPASPQLSSTSVSANQSSAPRRHPDEPHESFAPYWTAEPGWHTELQLRNNLAQGDLVVTPVLRLADGQSIKLTPVTIASAHAVSVNLHDALTVRAPYLVDKADSFGGVSNHRQHPTNRVNRGRLTSMIFVPLAEVVGCKNIKSIPT